MAQILTAALRTQIRPIPLTLAQDDRLELSAPGLTSQPLPALISQRTSIWFLLLGMARGIRVTRCHSVMYCGCMLRQGDCHATVGPRR